MKSRNKKKFSITIKVIVAHFLLIILLDLNISAFVKKDTDDFDNRNDVQFLNLKSISMEEIQKKRELIEKKKREIEAKKRKRKEEAQKKKERMLAEKQKKKEAERKKRIEDEKRKAEEEKLRKEQAEKKRKEELDQIRKDEMEKLATYELEKLERELREIERLEALIKQQAIRNAQLSDAEKRYILSIKAKIENNWLIPHDTKHNEICTAIVNQLPSGKVTSVKIHGCKGDQLYIDSLINAVWKSSPLPVAPDIEVFQEDIVLQFEEPK